MSAADSDQPASSSGLTSGPLDENAETGPLISEAHRDKVTDYVKRGVEAGARLRTGGHWGGPEHEKGFFYAPTVLDRCTRDNPAVIEEGFGPVITVETFSTEQEAIEIANHTEYGLAGAVWTSDAGTANRVSRALRHGTIWINDYHPYVPQAEWGGMKQSGIGRELGERPLLPHRRRVLERADAEMARGDAAEDRARLRPALAPDVLAGADDGAQIGRVLLPEAEVERTGRGQPDAVAAFAEIVGHRRDEAEAAAGFGHFHIAGRAARLVGNVGERETVREIGAHLRQG